MTVSQFVVIQYQSLSIANNTLNLVFGKTVKSYRILWHLAKYDANICLIIPISYVFSIEVNALKSMPEIYGRPVCLFVWSTHCGNWRLWPLPWRNLSTCPWEVELYTNYLVHDVMRAMLGRRPDICKFASRNMLARRPVQCQGILRSAVQGGRRWTWRS